MWSIMLAVTFVHPNAHVLSFTPAHVSKCVRRSENLNSQLQNLQLNLIKPNMFTRLRFNSSNWNGFLHAVQFASPSNQLWMHSLSNICLQLPHWIACSATETQMGQTKGSANLRSTWTASSRTSFSRPVWETINSATCSSTLWMNLWVSLTWSSSSQGSSGSLAGPYSLAF